MRFQTGGARGFLVVVLACVGCGGGSGPSGNPGGPTLPTVSTGGPSTISIVGDRGSQSFSPNPGAVGQDNSIVWRNNDSVAHRIVLNDNSQDTGSIAPGASSRAIPLPADGTNYHCSIHPGMVGAVRATGGAAPPPCTGIYCE
jgi:plastocyanin